MCLSACALERILLCLLRFYCCWILYHSTPKGKAMAGQGKGVQRGVQGGATHNWLLQRSVCEFACALLPMLGLLWLPFITRLAALFVMLCHTPTHPCVRYALLGLAWPGLPSCSFLFCVQQRLCCCCCRCGRGNFLGGSRQAGRNGEGRIEAWKAGSLCCRKRSNACHVGAVCLFVLLCWCGSLAWIATHSHSWE